MNRTPSQQDAHERVIAYDLKTLASHAKAREIMGAILAIADAGPYGSWTAEAIHDFMHSIFDHNASDIAKLRTALQKLPA